ncbi:MAG: hypothetical protein IJ113_09175, partial [Eggerthellaceae bacterium]|nr:hypothetical protein [Eggerthellaceae bacterium]
YDLSWVDKLRTCPYCGKEMEFDINQADPDIADFECECGFQGIVHPPYDLDPLKGVIKEIRL